MSAIQELLVPVCESHGLYYSCLLERFYGRDAAEIISDLATRRKMSSPLTHRRARLYNRGWRILKRNDQDPCLARAVNQLNREPGVTAGREPQAAMVSTYLPPY